MIEPIFSRRPDGQVDATLGPDFPLFNDALGDSISSLPPRGATGGGPSTYWIDIAAEGAMRAAAAGDGRPFTGGNCSTLSVSNEFVVANYDFAGPDEPGETIPLDAFLELLAEPVAVRSREQQGGAPYGPV